MKWSEQIQLNWAQRILTCHHSIYFGGRMTLLAGIPSGVRLALWISVFRRSSDAIQAYFSKRFYFQGQGDKSQGYFHLLVDFADVMLVFFAEQG